MNTIRFKIKVISQKGKYSSNRKIRDEIIITEKRVERKICIHTLYSILLKLFAMMYDAKFSWVSDGKKSKTYLS